MFIDLSHTVEHGMITYKGLPAPVITDHLSRADSRSHYEGGPSFTSARLRWSRTPAHTSTVPFIVMKPAMTFRNSIWAHSPILTRWLSEPAQVQNGRSLQRRCNDSISKTRPCSSKLVGTSTGARKNTL